MKNILVIYTVLLITNTYGQRLIKPGDPLLNYNLLGTFNPKYKMQFIDTAGNTKYETISERNSFVDKSSNQFILVQTRSLPNDKIIDSTIADLKTLSPIRMSMHSQSKNQEMNLTFKGNKIKAVVNKQGKKADTLHTISEPYFDSNLLEQILGIIKYETDSVFKLNTYVFEAGGLDTYIIKRIGKEKIVLNGNDMDTWHIIIYQQKSMTNGNKQGFEFWVEPKWGLVVKQQINYPGKGQFVMNIMQE